MGVTFHKRDKVWQVTSRREGKTKYMGSYHNKEDALRESEKSEEAPHYVPPRKIYNTQCVECGADLTYSRNKRLRCASCKSRYHRELAKERGEAYLENIREIRRRSAEKERRKHPERVLYNKAKYRARKRGIEFNLEEGDITIPDKCPILNIPLKQNYGGRAMWKYSPQLDRIDNRKGYVKGNIHVISKQANTMKNDASIEELKKLAKWVNENL